MTYEPFPDAQRFAVKFHRGCPHAPDGWPAEANPLDAGQEPPDGYLLRTGKELNALRAKLRKDYEAAVDANQVREFEETKKEHIQSAAEEADRIRALLDGSIVDAIGEAKNHDELAALRHRVPDGHKFASDGAKP